MSDNEKDVVRLKHIYDALATIERHLDGVSEESFHSDELLVNLLARQLSIIGEAMDSLSEAFREQHSDLPYREAKDMRNFIIHEYFGVSEKVLWDTYKKNLPKLQEALSKIKGTE